MKYYPVQVALLKEVEYDSDIFLVEKKEDVIEVERYQVNPTPIKPHHTCYSRYYKALDLNGRLVPRCAACGSMEDHSIPMEVDETVDPPFTCGCDIKEITPEEMETRLDDWVTKMNDCPEKYGIYLRPYKDSIF